MVDVDQMRKLPCAEGTCLAKLEIQCTSNLECSSAIKPILANLRVLRHEHGALSLVRILYGVQ